MIASAIKHISNTRIINTMLCITILDIIINFCYIFPNQIYSDSDLLSESVNINKIADNNPDTIKFDNLTEYIGDHPLYGNIGDTTSINTLSYFSSGYTADMTNRINYYNLTSSNNNVDYKGGNPLADIMLNIKYQIENIYDPTAYSIYDKIDSYNNYNLYKNPYYVSMGMVINNSDEIKKLTLADYYNKKDKDILDYQNKMVELMGGSSIYDKIECKEIKDNAEYDSNANYYTYGQIYTYTEKNSEEKQYIPISVKTGDNLKGKIYVEMDGKIYFAGEVDKHNHELLIDYPLELIENDEIFAPNLAILNEDNLKSFSEMLSKNKLTNLREDGKSIFADLDSSISGELYISLPYYDAWDIYVDEKLVEKERFMRGIGVKIDAGKHTVMMKYHPKGALSGIIISITTLILIIGYSIFEKYRKRSKRTKQ